jgi:alpha-tubulin suppressor-like RCC1 family protein
MNQQREFATSFVFLRHDYCSGKGYAALVGGLLILCLLSSCGNVAPPPKPQITVWAWGDNSYGELGDGTTTSRLSPVPVPNLQNIEAVRAGGYHSLALKDDGTVWQWGLNWGIEEPQTLPCTDLKNLCQLSPVQVTDSKGQPITDVRAVGVGFSHNLLVRSSDNTVWTWGDNSYGELGYGQDVGLVISPHISAYPSEVSNGPKAILGVGGGEGYSLALQSGPPHLLIWAWGRDGNDQLGVDGNDLCPPPCDLEPHRIAAGLVSGVKDMIDVAAGGSASMILMEDGTVWAWGDNSNCQLGLDVTELKRAIPAKVEQDVSTPMDHVITIAASYEHMLALKSDGTVWSWGDNRYGQLGHDGQVGCYDILSNSYAYGAYHPVQVSGLSGVKAIAAGDDYSLALKSDGTVWAWGDNSAGQLGASSREICILDRNGRKTAPCNTTPIQVTGLSGVIEVSAGVDHSFALVRSSGPSKSALRPAELLADLPRYGFIYLTTIHTAS